MYGVGVETRRWVQLPPVLLRRNGSHGCKAGGSGRGGSIRPLNVLKRLRVRRCHINDGPRAATSRASLLLVFGTQLAAGHHNEKFDFDERFSLLPSKRWRAPRSIFPRRRYLMQEIYRFIDDAIEADRHVIPILPIKSGIIQKHVLKSLVSGASGFGAGICRLHRYPHVGNIPNAFIASFGQGKPVIACWGNMTPWQV